MHTKRSQCVPRCFDGAEFIRHPNVPQLDLAVATAADEFSHASTLHMDVGNPLLVATISLDHRCSRLLPLIKDLNLAVSEPSDKNVTCHLI